MRQQRYASLQVRLLGCVILFAAMTAGLQSQVPADQAADLLLNSARKGYNEQNYPFAAAKFQEFLQKYGGHPQANAARYGLGLSLLEGPERTFDKAAEALGPLTGNAALPEHPYASYYLGVAQRGMALNDQTLMAGKQGAEAQQIKARMDQRLGEAARYFAQASNAFGAKLPKGDTLPKELPPELDWAARARADQAEVEIRLAKHKEARTTAEPFAKDPLLQKSQYRRLGLYYHGYSAFLLQDYLVAGRSLNQLAPFNDPIFGLHARYLMGRIYQLSGEQAESATMYDAVLTDYDKLKKEAIEALKRPDQFRTNPAEKTRLETLVKTPPDHVAGAVFHLACLQYEAGKFGEALPRFQAFAKDYPASPLQPEAALRVGFCQVQLKLFPEALATLTPLVEKQPRLADQVLLWMGKAQVGVAMSIDAGMNPQGRENGVKTAIATLRTAADRSGQLATQGDLDAKLRRGEILIELADTHQLIKMFKEAVPIYETVVNEKSIPNRMEEVAQRFVTALHLAGDYDRSDSMAAAFQKEYPKSTLLPAVAFRAAENAYFRAINAAKRPDFPKAELPKLFEESLKRYKSVIERFPDYERISVAKYGLAMTHFHRGEFEPAQKALETIPQAERVGDLGYAPYLLADCLLRQAPAKAEDALAVGELQEKLVAAQSNLEAFIGGFPKAPETPDAMLKLGYCQFRLAVIQAMPQERANGLAGSRKTFEVLIQQFGKEPAGVQAVLERAKCMEAQGDPNGAMNELRKFTQDPLQQHSAIAAIALPQLATMLRKQHKAEEAAQILNAARQRHEPPLNTAKDNERIALLRYHHGVCLQEANKHADARTQLESIPQLVPNKPMAVEAVLRSGQCRIVEGKNMIDAARKQLAMPKLNQEQLNAANNQLQAGFNAITEAAQNMERRAEEFRGAFQTEEARGRMLYDSAWASRFVADMELSTIRAKMQIERQKVLQAEADKRAAQGTKAPIVPLPEIARAEIPLQPSEQRARNTYQTLVNQYSDQLIGVEGRCELSEMMAERDEFDPAIKLLKEALDKETEKPPTPELIDKLRIRLGACYAGKKDFAAAIERFLLVANNPKSTLVAQAQYRAGECHLEMGEADKAVTRLAIFRDKPEFHNVPGVSDRAMLRLGHAHAALKQWDPSRLAFEVMVQRFPGSPWANDARFGIGWALQNASQFDPAVVAYNQVASATTNELAAKAHLQIGLCRLAQKKYGDATTAFLVVPFTFDYPELSAAALTEAARAFLEDSKPEQAERLLRRVLKDYANSEWAKIAQMRLESLQMKKSE